jgi:hypothetical protein
MSEPQEEWSKNQQTAYEYIRSAVARGLTATSAVQEYRSGGGHIANDFWYKQFKIQFAHAGWRETIDDMPETYTVSEKMYRQVDWDLREKYAVMGRVRGYSEEVGAYIEKWVTAESDVPLTKTEWRGYLAQAVYDTIGSPSFEVEEVLEWDAVMR